MAIDDLLIKLAKAFTKAKSQTVFLINNYDMTISVLKVGFGSQGLSSNEINEVKRQ